MSRHTGFNSYIFTHFYMVSCIFADLTFRLGLPSYLLMYNLLKQTWWPNYLTLEDIYPSFDNSYLLVDVYTVLCMNCTDIVIHPHALLRYCTKVKLEVQVYLNSSTITCESMFIKETVAEWYIITNYTIQRYFIKNPNKHETI